MLHLAPPDGGLALEAESKRRRVGRKRRKRRDRFDPIWVVVWLGVLLIGWLLIKPLLGSPLRPDRVQAIRQFVSGNSNHTNALVFQHDLVWAIWLAVAGRLSFIVGEIAWRRGKRLIRRLRWPERTWTVGEGNISLFAVAGEACGDPMYASTLAAANEGRDMGGGAIFDPMNLQPGWELIIPAGIPRRPSLRAVSMKRPEGLLGAERWRWDLLASEVVLPVVGGGWTRSMLREVLRSVHLGTEMPSTDFPRSEVPAWLRQDRSLPVWVDLALRHVAAQYAALGRSTPTVRQVRADRWAISIEIDEGGELLAGQWKSSGGTKTWSVLARNSENAALLARVSLEDMPVPLLVPFATSSASTPQFINLAVAGPLVLTNKGGGALGSLLLDNLGVVPWLDQLAIIVVGGAFLDDQVDARVSHPAEVAGAYERLVAKWPAYRGAILICDRMPQGIGAAALPAGMCMVIAGDQAA
jgi:hypothetical protein